MWKNLMYVVCVAATLSLASTGLADRVIGDWEEQMDGWRIHADAPAGTDARYSDSNGVTLGKHSLDLYVPVGGYKLILYYDVRSQGAFDDFLKYQKISIDVTRLAKDWPGAADWVGGGIHMVVNAGGDGWSLWEGAYAGWWSWSVGDQTATLTWDYAQYLPRIQVNNLWWLEIFFVTNFDLDYDTGGVYFLDNCKLWGSGAATEPKPANEAQNVATNSSLSWKASDTAASHTVFFGTDFDAVTNANVDSDPNLVTIASVNVPSFDPNGLDFGKTYFWRVDEVNGTDVYPGSVWTFTTANFIVVDDFESYTNNSPNRVFQSWIDGLGFSKDGFFPEGNTGNGTGAIVGYDPAMGDIMEKANVHGGAQAMPMDYDNKDLKYSEAVRTWSEPQNWTLNNYDTMKLYIRGGVDNGADRLYVTLEDSAGKSATVAHTDAAILNAAGWTEWVIPLSSFAGVNAASVAKIAIGVGDLSNPKKSAGRLFVDDIRVTAKPRGLIAHYKLENNVEDSSGNGIRGTLAGSATLPASYVNGPTGFGKAMQFDGAYGHQYVDLGTFNPSAATGQLTVALWAKWDGLTDQWQGLISKRDSWSRYDMMWQIEANQSTGLVRFQRDGEGEVPAVTLPTGVWTHIAATFDGATAIVYVNGEQTGQDTSWSFGYDPEAAIQIGACDPGGGNPFNGAIDDVWIYDTVLSQAEIKALAGK